MTRRDVPGSCLLGVWPALAAAILAFNVHYLRVEHPGVVSGKLSDLAINFLLPLILVAASEWLLAAAAFVRGREFRALGAREHVIACVVSAVYFGLLQVVPAFVDVHARVASVLDLPFGGCRTFHHNVADLPDLLTLVTTVFAARHLRVLHQACKKTWTWKRSPAST